MNFVEEVRQEIEQELTEKRKQEVKNYVRIELERLKTINSNIKNFEDERINIEARLKKIEEGDYKNVPKGDWLHYVSENNTYNGLNSDNQPKLKSTVLCTQFPRF